jgi:hypothetical protein
VVDHLHLKTRILNEIRRLAADNDGVAPGKAAFEKATGIKESAWKGRIWTKWSQIISELGFDQKDFTVAYETDLLFKKLRHCAAHFQKFPTYAEIMIFKQVDNDMPSASTFQKRFDRIGLRRDFKDWMLKQPDLSDREIAIVSLIDLEPSPLLNQESDFKNGYVYAIEFGAYYKIGRSNDIERRIKQINVALPEKGEIVHFIETDDPVGIEEYWHKRFDQYRENGEWFKLPAKELAAFKKRKFQ